MLHILWSLFGILEDDSQDIVKKVADIRVVWCGVSLARSVDDAVAGQTWLTMRGVKL